MNTLKLWPDVGRDILHLSRNATYDAAARGAIPIIRFGKTIRVPEAALKRLLDSAAPKPVE
jgi:D-hexose-6-phosphate mutarotase